MPCGRMIRLRSFHGAPEWQGRWSDNDSAWTNPLRQAPSQHGIASHRIASHTGDSGLTCVTTALLCDAMRCDATMPCDAMWCQALSYSKDESDGTFWIPQPEP